MARAKPSRAAVPPCEHCGRPARGPALGDWRFCKARCRAAWLAARSRRAAAAGKKLRCPFCAKGNPARARRCAHCKERLLWRERSPVWTAIVWTFRLWMLAVLAGLAYGAYYFGNMASSLGVGDAGSLTSLLGPGGQALGGQIQDVVDRGGSPEEVEQALRRQPGIARMAQGLFTRTRQDPGASPDPAAPRVPGPGTWLVGRGGMPPLLFAANPTEPDFWPADFGAKTPAQKSQAIMGMVTSGKVKVFLQPRLARVLEEGQFFSKLALDGGAEGWAPNGQIVER